MKYLLSFVLALIVGCGDEYSYSEEDDAGIGAVEQGFNSDNTNNWLQGIRAVSSLPPAQCRTDQPSTSNCQIPEFKFGKTYCVDPLVGPTGWATTTERNAIRNVLANASSGIRSQISAFGIQPGDVGWGHTIRTNGSQCQSTDIIVTKSALPPVGGNNMIGYARFSGLSFTPLTESLPGTFSKFVNGSLFIDKADIDARGATLTEDTQLLVHAVSLAYANSMGIGTTVNTVGTATDPGVTPFVGTSGTITSGQACRAAHFRHGTLTAYTSGPNVTPACANN
jgi:hypothetical protein